MAGLGLFKPALAQGLPDAGALQQSQELRLQDSPRVLKRIESSPAKPELSSMVGKSTVRAKEFRYSGNAALDEQALNRATAPWVGRDLDMAGLQKAIDAIEALYRSHGRVARAVLPRQDITQGIIGIQIIEGVLGQILMEGSRQHGAIQGQVEGIIQAANPPGRLIDGFALDRALLLANDLPGVAVLGSLRAGTADGTTDLVIKLSERPKVFGEISLDSNAPQSTGSTQIAAAAGWNNPVGLGDLLNVNLARTKGSAYLKADYSLPLGVRGWRVGADVSLLSYRLTAPEFAALDAQGHSFILDMYARYPWIRGYKNNVSFAANLTRKRFHNDAGGISQSDYAVHSASLAVSANQSDEIWGSGKATAYLALQAGQVALGAPDVGESLAMQGSFCKLVFDVARQQTLTPSLSISARLRGQYSPASLDSSERFYLGGGQSIRAYPVNEASGPSGGSLNLELHYRLHQGVDSFAFYDAGQVRNPGTNAKLSGAGLGLSWSPSPHFYARVFLAQRIGTTPNLTSTGRNQDGSQERRRAWIQITANF